MWPAIIPSTNTGSTWCCAALSAMSPSSSRTKGSMLVLLRIIFTGIFFYCVVRARDNAQNNLVGGDMENAFWVGAGVLVAIACAIVWAPYIGGKVADPLTGGMVN